MAGRLAASAHDEAESLDSVAPVLRTYGVGAQILKDLGISRMRVLSAPKILHGIAAFGLEVEAYVGDDDGASPI